MITFPYHLVIVAIVIGLLFELWKSKSVQNWHKNRLRFAEAASKIPGPRSLPLIGNALMFACKQEEILFRIMELGKLYESPFRWWLGSKLMVGIKKAEDIKTIMLSPNATYKDAVYRFLEVLFGRGIVTSSGPVLKTHRKVIVALFNKKTNNSFVHYFDKHSKRCVERLEVRVDTGEFDVYQYMELCAVDSALETIMGTPGITQRGGHQELISHIAKMYKLAFERTFKIWLHPDFIHSWTKYKKLQDISTTVIRKFMDNLVVLKKKEYHTMRSSGLSGTPRTMLIEQLVAHNEQTGLMDDDRLRDEILTIFIAGEDSTTSVSSFVLLMLGMYPVIQEKVRTELFEVLGAEESVTSDNISKLKYLSMVIKETLRLFPVGPVLVRKLTGDVQLESCKLPKGCGVAMTPFLTHRDPEYWSDPDKFDPDRFTPENSVGRHPYAYLPFSSGLRSCIGQEYAGLYVKTIVVNVLKKYRLSSNGSLNDIKLKADLVLRSADGYKISITRL